uniref:Uncharacterized protein n=1 Tax=Anguilla anguilla TaxID=7936 RepID=A0A0E9URY4_ANGAN
MNKNADSLKLTADAMGAFLYNAVTALRFSIPLLATGCAHKL